MHINEGKHHVGRRRHRHSVEFRAEAIATCMQSDVSIASGALSHGFKVNLLRHWIIDERG